MIKNSCSKAASPGEQKVYHTPVLQKHAFLFLSDISGPKDESLLLRKYLIAFECNDTDYLPCVLVASDCIPIRKLFYLDPLVLKIKMVLPHSPSQSTRYR